LFVQHAQHYGQVTFWIRNDWIGKFAGNIEAIVFDVLKCVAESLSRLSSTYFRLKEKNTNINPIDVAVKRIHTVSQNFHITFDKFRHMDGNSTQFGGANWCEISWMRKEDAPTER
jgi:hypothetical protein